jgi:hypothetical protein
VADGRDADGPGAVAERRRRGVFAALLAVALAAAAAGALQLAWHAGLFAARAPFPLDLEWMEGGMLLHAQRLAAGQTVYVEPSLDFIPFFYTPLYPALLALLSKAVGLGYFMGRLVSLGSLAAALGLLVAGAVGQGAAFGGRGRALGAAAGLAGAGVVVGGFVFSGTFYDLVRADALLLALEALALFVAYRGTTWRSAAVAGAAIALAFFTKQTASVVGVAIGLGLLATNLRRGLVYGLVAAPLLGLGLWFLNATSDGWFWTYIFKGHQNHEFYWARAFRETPLVLGRHGAFTFGALALAAVGLALGGRLQRRDLLLGAAAVGGVVAACVGFGTQWAVENAYIPAVYFPAFAAALLGARLLAHGAHSARVGAAATAALAVAALGGQALADGRPDGRRFAPGPADRAAARVFLERLRALPGDLFVPFHPYYAVLVGKRPYLHRMGVWDVAGFYGRPRGLDEAIAAQRFDHVVMDWKVRPSDFPGLDARYRIVRELREGEDSVRMFSGAETSPRWILAPTRAAPPLPPEGRRIDDFEGGGWAGWTPEGEAFLGGPAPAPPELFGRGAADSGARGAGAQGVLRSAPLRIDRPRLRFSWVGPADARLAARLLDGPDAPRAATPKGGFETVEWDVSDLMGREVIFQLEDRSPDAGIAVDELVLH